MLDDSDASSIEGTDNVQGDGDGIFITSRLYQEPFYTAYSLGVKSTKTKSK
jgi:hypothetical protein